MIRTSQEIIEMHGRIPFAFSKEMEDFKELRWLPEDEVKKQFDELIEGFEKYCNGVKKNEKLFSLAKLFITHLKERKQILDLK